MRVNLITVLSIWFCSFAISLTTDEEEQQALTSPTTPGVPDANSPVTPVFRGGPVDDDGASLNSKKGSEKATSTNSKNEKIDKMKTQMQLKDDEIALLETEATTQAETIATYEDILDAVQDAMKGKDADIEALKQGNQANTASMTRADSVVAADSEDTDTLALLMEIQQLKQKLKEETAEKEKVKNEAAEFAQRLLVTNCQMTSHQLQAPQAFPVAAAAAAAAPLPRPGVIGHDYGGWGVYQDPSTFATPQSPGYCSQTRDQPRRRRNRGRGSRGGHGQHTGDLISLSGASAEDVGGGAPAAASAQSAQNGVIFPVGSEQE